MYKKLTKSNLTRLFILSFIFILKINVAQAVNFKNFDELNNCVDNYNSFSQYKINLQKCFEQKEIKINKESLELIKNDSGLINNIVDLNLPEEKKIQKPIKKLTKNLMDIFFKPSELLEVEDKKKFTLNNKNFRKLNRYIKKNPENIFALTEDINILTYKNNYLSEFKRQEVLLNVYNSFDVAVLASKASQPVEAAAFGGAGAMVAAAAVAVAAGGSGGSGGSSPIPATLSFTVSSTAVGECDSNVTITANLTKAHSENVTVTYAVGGTATKDTDYELSSTTSTIVAGATSGTITLNPTNDTTAEISETVTLAASVSGVSTTGNTSTTITIHDYVLKCNATAFSEGTTSEQNTIKGRSVWTALKRNDSTIHPYEQMNLHKVQSFSSNGVNLTGTGETIHVADFNCNAAHDIFDNKTVTHLDDGGSGESTARTADADDNHCQGVAALAVGDINSGRTGVAPDADIILSSIPETGTHTRSAQAHAADLDLVRAAGAIVSNHSWGMGTFVSGVDNASEIETYMNDNSLSVSQTYAKLRHNNTGSTSVAQWETWITSLKNYQDTGVIVFASGNTKTESDAGGMAALPYFYDGTKHSTDLTKAWINAIVVDYSGDADLSNATLSEFDRKGNPCGKTAQFCLSVDGYDMFSATYVNGSGTSLYNTDTDKISWGSSWSAPMVSGGIALMAQAFPSHTPEQLVDRVLASANNVWFTPDGNTTFTTHGASIKHGYNDTFGHGLPDFYAALSPIISDSNPASFGFASPSGSGGSGGSGSVPFSQVEKLAVSDTGMIASSSFGDGIINGLKGKTAYAYDALNGGFKYKITDFINYNTLTEQKIDHTLDQEINHLRNFKFSENKTAKDFDVYAGEYINFRDKYNRGLSVTLDQPNIALQNFNLYNNRDYKNPFTSENKGVGFNNKFYFFGNNVLLGYNNSKFNPITNINKNSVVPMETLALSMNIDSDKFDLLSFTTGLLKEENTFLLSEGSGAFNLTNKNNLSNFYGFNFSKSLNNFGNIYFSSMFGNSKLDNTQNSLIVDTSNVLSSSFEVNYELKNIFNNDQLNISFSQPNRVEDGEMTFRFMGLADKNGILPYQDHKVSLTPSGRQKDLTVSYYKNHLRNLKTGIKAILIDDLGHIKDNNLDANLLLTATYNF